jgi:hypothetical protein
VVAYWNSLVPPPDHRTVSSFVDFKSNLHKLTWVSICISQDEHTLVLKILHLLMLWWAYNVLSHPKHTSKLKKRQQHMSVLMYIEFSMFFVSAWEWYSKIRTALHVWLMKVVCSPTSEGQQALVLGRLENMYQLSEEYIWLLSCSWMCICNYFKTKK